MQTYATMHMGHMRCTRSSTREITHRKCRKAGTYLSYADITAPPRAGPCSATHAAACPAGQTRRTHHRACAAAAGAPRALALAPREEALHGARRSGARALGGRRARARRRPPRHEGQAQLAADVGRQRGQGLRVQVLRGWQAGTRVRVAQAGAPVGRPRRPARLSQGRQHALVAGLVRAASERWAPGGPWCSRAAARRCA